MDGNDSVIKQIIDTGATSQQYKTLSTQLIDLDETFIKVTKDIIAFSTAAANAKGFTEFSKNAAAAAIAAEKLIQVQNQTIVTQAKVNQAKAAEEVANNRLTISANSLAASNARAQTAQEKATASTQKALSPYQQLSKELDRQRLAAKDLGVQYGLLDPRFTKAQAGVLKLDKQLKDLDKSLGQSQRNVGNYTDSFRSAFEGLYSVLDRAIPGAGQFTRVVVDGFQKITSEAGKSKNAITAFTQGGFGFKPNIDPGATVIDNTAATNANTEAAAANTAANEANAESEAAKSAATGKATISTEENTVATEESSGVLSKLGLGFAGFSTLAFVAAIASAAYYLSQFKSTGNSVSEFFAGLKNTLAESGEGIVNTLKGVKRQQSEQTKEADAEYIAAFNKLSTLQKLFGGALFIKTKTQPSKESAFDRGKGAQETKIQLDNINELEEAENAQLTAEAERGRALSKDKNFQITVRQKYLKDAQIAEQKILDNEKANAQKTIDVSIQLSQKLTKLTPDQVKRLQSGDLKFAQQLALNGQQFTGEAFDLYKQGIQKKIAYQEGASNELIKLQADADNMQLRADNGLAKAQDRLDKARVQSALDASKLILDDTQKSGEDKLKANQKFVDDSIRLIKIQQKDELENAGLGSTRGGKDSRTEAKTRLAIEVETQNSINKVKADGMKNETSINKATAEEYAKIEKLKYEAALGELKNYELAQKEISDERLLQIDKNHSDEAAALTKQYTDGLISAEQYNSKITQLDKATALQRIATQIDAQKKILIAQSVNLAIGRGPGKAVGSPKDAQETANNLVKLQIQLSDLQTKNEIDNIQKVQAAKQQNADLEKSLQEESIQIFQELIDNGYQKQLDALKKQEDQINITANAQKTSVNDALLSNKQKAKEDQIIDAQAVQSKQLLADKEALIKQKEATFNRAISIFNIGLNTAESVAKIEAAIAVAEAQATLYLSNPLTAALYPGIAALIAAQEVEVGLTVASGLAQIAALAIAPKYAKGVKDHKGGKAWVGDGGGPELIKLPNGNSFLSPGAATLMDLPQHTTVVPHLETVKHIEKLSYAGGQAISMTEVTELLRQSNKYQKRIADKSNENRNVGLDLVAAAKLLDRQRSYFK